MKDDMMQMIKERLLDELIDKMSDGDSRMKPVHGLGVEVQAPDKEHLADGLDKAKEVLDSGKVPELEADEHSDHMEHIPEDDEERMLELLAEEDGEEDKY
jgi:hypothetical protein